MPDSVAHACTRDRASSFILSPITFHPCWGHLEEGVTKKKQRWWGEGAGAMQGTPAEERERGLKRSKKLEIIIATVVAIEQGGRIVYGNNAFCGRRGLKSLGYVCSSFDGQKVWGEY